MSMFNKQGTEFTNLVTVQPLPNQKTTYSHKFPTIGPGGKVIERWSTKVRPIKDLTGLLKGCQLKRNIDYMVDFNAKTNLYEYWFLDSRHAFMFQIASSSVMQTVAKQSHKFDIVCPHCQTQFATEQITWA